MDDRTFLDHLIPVLDERTNDPLVIPWPSPGNLAGLVTFSDIHQWRDFVLGLSVTGAVPGVVVTKFRRAQKLFFLGWVDADLIKAGELVGFTALELALKDCYGTPGSRENFANLLKHVVENGLTDDKVPMFQRYGGTIVGPLTGDTKLSLAEIRNSLAHGDAPDGLPWGGLLELLRDLIDYAYRDHPLPAHR